MSHLWYHPMRIAVSFIYITHGLHGFVFLQKPQNKHKLTLFSSHWIQRNDDLELRKFKRLAQTLTSIMRMNEFRAQKFLLDLKCLLLWANLLLPFYSKSSWLTHIVCASKIPVHAICWILILKKFNVFYVFIFLQQPLPVFDFWIIWPWSICTDLV